MCLMVSDLGCLPLKTRVRLPLGPQHTLRIELAEMTIAKSDADNNILGNTLREIA